MSVRISVGVDVTILTAVKGSLGTEFNVEEGETITQDDGVTLTLSEPIIVSYVIQWYETWETGTVVIDNLGLSLPYEVRVGIGADIVENRREICPTPIANGTPTETATSTFTISPTSTITPTNVLIRATATLTSNATLEHLRTEAAHASQTAVARPATATATPSAMLDPIRTQAAHATETATARQ